MVAKQEAAKRDADLSECIQNDMERAMTRNEMHQQMNFAQQTTATRLPDLPTVYRDMAEQVRCLRCKWEDPEGCWECSGTGIMPIPWAEVQSGYRGTDDNQFAWNAGMVQAMSNIQQMPSLLSKAQPVYADTMKIAGKGTFFKAIDGLKKWRS